MPGSTSRSIRSRAVIFPRERWRSSAVLLPPIETSAVRSRSSDTSAVIRVAAAPELVGTGVDMRDERGHRQERTVCASVTFGILTVIVLAGLAGPLLSSSDRVLVPVIVGELLAGLVVGSSGFGWVHPDDPTHAFLAAIGFAMLMFAAGLHVPVRQPQLARQLGRGAAAAGIAAVLAVAGGWVARAGEPVSPTPGSTP